MKRIAYLVALGVFVVACEAPETPGKKSIDSILIEWVDMETSGKRHGGTHFHLGDEELFLDYEFFDDIDKSTSKLAESRSKAKRILEESIVIGSDGQRVGMLLLVESDPDPPNLRYCLIWTNRNKFTNVCSQSTEALQSFRNNYEL